MAIGDSPESLQEEKVLRQQKAKLKTLREDGRALQEQIDKTIELRNAKEAKVAMLQEDIKNAQLAIEEQQKVLDDKRDVKRPLEEATKALREDEAKLARLQKKLQNLQATIDGKQKLLNESEVLLADLNEQEAALTVKEAGLREHQKKTEELQKKIEQQDEANREQLRSIEERKEQFDKELASMSEANEERVRNLNWTLEKEGRIVKPGLDAKDQGESLTRGKLEEASVEIAKFAEEARRQIEDTRRLANAKHQETEAELAKFTDELRQQLEESRRLLSQTDLDWQNFWKKLKCGSDSDIKELEAGWHKLETLEPGLVLKLVEAFRRENEKHEGESKPEAYAKAAPFSDLCGFLTEFEAKVLSLSEETGVKRNSTIPRKLLVRSILIVMYEKGRELEAELGFDSETWPNVPDDSLLRGLEGSGQQDGENGEPTHNSRSSADLLANDGPLSELQEVMRRISEFQEEMRRLKAEIETSSEAGHDTQDSGADINQETSAGSQPKRRDVLGCLDRTLFCLGLIVLSYPVITAYSRKVLGCVMSGDCF